MISEIGCPCCGNNALKTCPGVRWYVNLIIAILFWPAWIISLIITYATTSYKCGVCGNIFGENIIKALIAKKRIPGLNDGSEK